MQFSGIHRQDILQRFLDRKPHSCELLSPYIQSFVAISECAALFNLATLKLCHLETCKIIPAPDALSNDPRGSEFKARFVTGH